MKAAAEDAKKYFDGSIPDGYKDKIAGLIPQFETMRQKAIAGTLSVEELNRSMTEIDKAIAGLDFKVWLDGLR